MTRIGSDLHFRIWISIGNAKVVGGGGGDRSSLPRVGKVRDETTCQDWHDVNDELQGLVQVLFLVLLLLIQVL